MSRHAAVNVTKRVSKLKRTVCLVIGAVAGILVFAGALVAAVCDGPALWIGLGVEFAAAPLLILGLHAWIEWRPL